MKKLFVVFAFMATIVGCQKSGDTMLVNTKWQSDDYTMINMIWGYSYHVYEFYSEDSASSYWLDKNGNIADSEGDVKYELDYPELTITESNGTVTKFTFSDRVTFAIGGNSTVVYHKK